MVVEAESFRHRGRSLVRSMDGSTGPGLKLLGTLASAARWCWKSPSRGASSIRRGLAAVARQCRTRITAGLKSITSRRGLAVLAVVVVAFVLGIVVAQAWNSDDSNDGSAPQSSAGASEPTATPPQTSTETTETDPATASDSAGSTAERAPTGSNSPEPPGDQPSSTLGSGAEPTAVPEPSPTPVVVLLEQEPPTYESALAIAAGLAPHTIFPSDCMSPLPHPDLLPNAPRTYRFGVHQGVDFRCFSLGRSAVAALDGRVVLIVGDYQDPAPNDRDELLEIAGDLEATPPFTLLTLYGNFVVIDHGVFPYIGHVVTVYAHLHEVDPGVGVGQTIRAGQRIGDIGNRGTHAAANGDFYDDPHLHWELHINNQYLGAGLTAEQTREVYTTLFSESLG